MAHYKRGYPRSSSRYSRDKWKAKKTRWGKDRWFWLTQWPRAWDVVMHTRPNRRRQREAIVQVMQGYDPDGVVWPLSKKPHIYYW